MKCYLCKRSFDSIKFLICHYRIVHKLEKNSTYVCVENNCTRSFSLLDSFRNHLQTDHSPKMNSAPTTKSRSRDTTITSESQVFLPGTTLNNCNNSTLTSNDSICIGTDNSKKNDVNELPTDDELLELIEKQICTFITFIYSISVLPRNIVQVIIDEFNNINLPLQIIKSKVLTIFDQYKVPLEVKNKVNSMFQLYYMEKFRTEHLRLKYLQKNGLYIKPEPHIIGENFENINGIQTPKNYKADTMNIAENLKKFLEIDGVLDSMEKYANDLQNQNNSVLSSILQGELWKTKIANFDGKTVFPILLNYDDFETGNLVRSHSGIQQIGAAYISIPGIPPPYNSFLENIFPASYFYTADLKKFGSRVVFSKLINYFNELEKHGILVETKERKIQVYFIFIMAHGDNLGMNKILGYNQSFNSTNYCRFCNATRHEARFMTSVKNTHLRSYEEYVRDCELKTNGVKENCIFNDVVSYHVLENYAVDIMHDGWEGITSLEMGLILHRLIIVDKIIPYEIFDAKLSNFNFGFESCKPPKITFENIKNKSLRMSAAEMKCFVTYVGIIFGSKILENNDYWSLYIKLREIMSLLMPKHFDLECCDHLKTLIQEHHELYIRLFGPLKPKHHFFLHYPDIIKKIGPVSNVSSMLFESKHRECKLSTNPVASRVNISHTIAVKQQLKFAHRLASGTGFEKDLSHGRIESMEIDRDLEEFRETISSDKFSIVPWVKVHNTTYKNGYIVSLNTDGDYPVFGEIQNILLNNEDKDVIFHLIIFQTQFFDEILCAFNVTVSSKKMFISQSDLRSHSPQIKVFRDDFLKIYIVPRL